MAHIVALLREFTIKDRRIPVENGMARFDGQEFDMKTELPFKGPMGKYYKLEDIWYMLQQRHLQWMQYMQECTKHEFTFVAFLDHKDILNYLTGVTASSSKLDANYKPPAAVAAPAPVVPAVAAPVVAAPTAGTAEPASLGAGDDDGPADDMLSMPTMDLAPMDTGADDQYDPAAAPEDNEQVAAPRPLTDMDRKKLARKQETLRRDKEEVLKIGLDREVKLKEILADAEEVAALQALERPTVTRDSLLRSQTRNFKHLLNLMHMRAHEGKNLRRGTSTGGKSGASSSSSSSSSGKRERSSSSASRSGRSAPPSASDASKKARPDKSTIPIIIVPAAASASLTLLNARDFLVEGLFVPTKTKKEELKGNIPTGKVSFVRQSIDDDGTQRSCPYEVVDTTAHFTSAHWKRVVAVFAFGKEWQFKDWKLGDTATMFARVCGFYMAVRGETVPAAISGWNVTQLLVDKPARHPALIAQRTFWEVVDRSAAKHPRLRLK